jgi:hypothetical protein
LKEAEGVHKRNWRWGQERERSQSPEQKEGQEVEWGEECLQGRRPGREAQAHRSSLKNLLITIQAYAFRAGRGLIHGFKVHVLDTVLNVLVSVLIGFRVLHCTDAGSCLWLISALSVSVVHLATLEAMLVIDYSFVDDWVFQVTTELWGDLRQVGLGVRQCAVGCKPSRAALLLCSFLRLVSGRNEGSLVEPVRGEHGRQEQPLQGRLESLMQKVDLLFVIHDGSGLADSVVELAMVKQVRAGVHAKLLANVVELRLRAGNVVGIIKAKVEVLLEARPKALPAVCG